MEFSKPARTIEKQIALLKRKGLHISDYDLAKHYLRYVTYYRLRAYWLPFEKTSTFKENTDFQDVVDLYVFDREFRLLIIDATERIEIAVRGAWAYHMAIKYGSHGYALSSLYKNKDNFLSSCALLIKEVERSTEDRNAIARTFGLDERVFFSFMHHISHVRNICAHHGRLWNRDFVFKMRLPTHPKILNNSLNVQRPKNIYNTLCVVNFLLNGISPTSSWRVRMMELLNAPNLDLTAMGFPTNWENRPIWKANSAA